MIVETGLDKTWSVLPDFSEASVSEFLQLAETL